MSLDARVRQGTGGHGHAVVIGSSIAGLTAARALAGLMDRVTVIERDWVPTGVGRRRGVPQARHTHTLAQPARHGLEQLFPGITEDLTRAGADHIRMPLDTLLYGPAGWLPRFDSGLSVLSAGRDLIDTVIRDRLRADPAVTFLPGHEALSLQPGPQDTVTGVWVRARDRGAPDGWTTRRLISADFVVDATGRDSRAPRWLADLGYQPPRESVAASRTTYATALLTPPVGHFADWKSVLITASDAQPGHGVLHPVEGGRWSVTLASADGGPPPADHDSLVRAAAGLGHPLLRELIESATPLGPVYSCGRTENRWRHYEELRRWPDQFLAVGDALTALDPVHGQGMTTAVDCALVLGHLLASHGTPVGLGHRLRRALAHRLTPAWRLSTHNLTAADGRGDPLAGLRARTGRRYTARVAAAATADQHAATLLVELLQGAAPPVAALRPAVLRAALRPRRRPAPPAPPSSTHGPGAPRRRRLAREAGSPGKAAASPYPAAGRTERSNTLPL